MPGPDQDPIEVESPRVAARVAEVKALLKRTIAGTGISQREVERRLGWGEGYLSQILRGKVAFKFKHCFAILGAIGVEPAAFFLGLDVPPPRSPTPPLESPERDELRSQVERIVRELLRGREGLEEDG